MQERNYTIGIKIKKRRHKSHQGIIVRNILRNFQGEYCPINLRLFSISRATKTSQSNSV